VGSPAKIESQRPAVQQALAWLTYLRQWAAALTVFVIFFCLKAFIGRAQTLGEIAIPGWIWGIGQGLFLSIFGLLMGFRPDERVAPPLLAKRADAWPAILLLERSKDASKTELGYLDREAGGFAFTSAKGTVAIPRPAPNQFSIEDGRLVSVFDRFEDRATRVVITPFPMWWDGTAVHEFTNLYDNFAEWVTAGNADETQVPRVVSDRWSGWQGSVKYILIMASVYFTPPALYWLIARLLAR
jgi:hypothetical protein